MKDFKSANFPIDNQGRTYHVQTKEGEVASRILTVGDPERAKRIATLLDSVEHSILSNRAFLTITGKYKGTRVSLIAIGMGTPNADMMVREVRAVTDGPLLIVRFGSCGGINVAKPGSITVATNGAVMITRNYDYFTQRCNPGQTRNPDLVPYYISSLIPSDPVLSQNLVKFLGKELGEEKVVPGIQASADSFYSSQGRQDITFGDDNQSLIENLCAKHPMAESLEMESGMILHLAQLATHEFNNNLETKNLHRGPIRACSSAMIFFNRLTNQAISPEYVPVLELNAGKAILEALIATDLN